MPDYIRHGCNGQVGSDHAACRTSAMGVSATCPGSTDVEAESASLRVTAEHGGAILSALTWSAIARAGCPGGGAPG